MTNPTGEHPSPTHHKLNIAYTVTGWMDKYLGGLNDTGTRNIDLCEEILGGILIMRRQVKNQNVTLYGNNPIFVRQTGCENTWRKILVFEGYQSGLKQTCDFTMKSAERHGNVMVSDSHLSFS